MRSLMRAVLLPALLLAGAAPERNAAAPAYNWLPEAPSL